MHLTQMYGMCIWRAGSERVSVNHNVVKGIPQWLLIHSGSHIDVRTNFAISEGDKVDTYHYLDTANLYSSQGWVDSKATINVSNTVIVHASESWPWEALQIARSAGLVRGEPFHADLPII